MSKSPSRVLARQGGGYVLTGGAAAVVDLAAFWLAIEAGVPIFVAAVGSFCLAAVVNFSLSARFVFGADINLRGFGKFFAFALIGLLINVCLTTFVGHLGVPPMLAKLLGIAAAFIVNFLANALIVFRKPEA